jgi:xylan 1,4-beta-xylosidase
MPCITRRLRAWACCLSFLGCSLLALAADTPAPVAVTVDWSGVAGQTSPQSYGVNGFTAFDPINAANPKYQQNLAYMGVGIIRFHSWDMINDSSVSASGWLDVKNQKWDAQKIEASLAAFKGSKAAILINIPGFPAWFKTQDDILDAGEVGRYAAFCAELVKIVNLQNKNAVKYWEITNERDDPYWVHALQNNGLVHTAALAELFNQCALAMKAVDPTIKTGGPAAARPDYIEPLRAFVKAVLPNLDFFSFHAYASGSTDDSDLTIFEKAKSLGDKVTQIRKMLDEESPSRHIPVDLNEYNISWSWQIQDERMKNYKGAIFDALALTSMAKAGAEATCAWNERDGVYGKMDADYNLRPSADVFHLLNTYGVGTLVPTTVADSDRVSAFAVQGSGGSRLLLLINEAMTDHAVVVHAGNWSGPADRYVLDKDGLHDDKASLADLGNAFILPGHSLVFWVATTRSTTP